MNTNLKPSVPAEYDWSHAPIEQAKSRLAKMEIEISKARNAMNTRISKEPKVWKCWCQSPEARGMVPKSVLEQCRVHIPDGRWVFRDDGAIDKEGNKKSIVVCSSHCFTVYQQQSQRMRAQAKGVGTVPPPVGILAEEVKA